MLLKCDPIQIEQKALNFSKKLSLVTFSLRWIEDRSMMRGNTKFLNISV